MFISAKSHLVQQTSASHCACHGVFCVLLLFGVLFGCAAKQAQPSGAIPSSDAPAQQKLVEHAAKAICDMHDVSRYPGFSDALEQAEGVLIFPNYFRLGFMASLGGGSGVLLARDDFGQWSSPAFYGMGKGGYGFQAGIESGALVFLFFDRDYMLAGLDEGYDLSMDADVVVGTTVDRVGVSRLSTEKPVLLYTDMSGLYAGVSFSGGYVKPDAGNNAAYYGTNSATPENIVMHWQHWRRDAQPLWEALAANVDQTRSSVVKPATSAGSVPNPLIHNVYTTP